MAIKLNTWYDEVAINAPGATIANIDFALQKSLAEFLRRSGAYMREINGIQGRAGRDTYFIPKQPEGTIQFVHAMFYNGQALRFVDAFSWQTAVKSQPTDVPTMFRRYVDDPFRFTVSPVPTIDLPYKFIPFVSFGYDRSCLENIPDFYSAQWYDAILSGAIFRLCSQQNKPFTDPTVAMYHGKKFSALIATARDQARKQFTASETPIRFPEWA